ncbi:MAG: hypothetical protein IT463_14730 [Planctomycetes bacterium]|nr:hypothetical protein [Planctomycetota bacterium]
MGDEHVSRGPSFVRRWWAVAPLTALLGWEFYTAHAAQRSPDWMWVGVAAAGLVFLVIARGVLKW